MTSHQTEDVLSDDSSDWSSAEDIEDWKQDLGQTLCLFCSEKFDSIDKSFVHLKTCHDLDLIEICVKNGFNCFDYIKLINYIRSNKPESSLISQLIQSKVFESEEFMKPVISDDQMLTFDIESESLLSENDLTTSNGNSDYEQLSNKELILRLRHSEQHIKELEKQLTDLKDLVNSCVTEDTPRERDVNVSQLSASEDSHYVSSYSHFAIHYEMLSDGIRTKSYEDAILKNRNFFKDKTVLDIGCGTGILSLFAAKAGAKLVVAVDASDIIYKAMDIAIENRFDSKIRFIKDKVESIRFEAHGLPQKYDIIVSEWMGYFLLFEGMLDSILYARNALLNDSGVLMPNRTTLSIAGTSDQDLQKRFIRFWDNVYGFRMTSMKSDVLSEAIVETVVQSRINTSVSVIKAFDLMQCTPEETHTFETTFQLISSTDEPIVAIIGWFDCIFDFEEFEHKCILSTTPFSEGTTHWKQTVFLLRKPIVCKVNDKIEGKIKVYRNVKEIRSLIVEIAFNSNEKQVFYLS